MQMKLYSILIPVILLFFGCAESSHDGRLVHIAEIVSDNPEEALRCLDSISVASLTEADRHYYDFLTVKATDKAYILHKSDSLILDVINYYASHDEDKLYPEVLYYGGRVYTDLGDGPLALRYYQMSIEESKKQPDPELEYRLLSQTGRLLNSINLFDEAVPYIEAALEIERKDNDTLKIINDLHLLGGTYLRACDYAPAEKYFRDAYYLSNGFPEYKVAKSNMYIAATKYKLGQLDSAIYYIKDIPNQIDSLNRNGSLAYASSIYLKAGMLDSAYKYADELIHSADWEHKDTGYQNILDYRLREYINPDSLETYVYRYSDLLDKFYGENELQLTNTQQAYYNYQQHEQKRMRAEKSNKFLKSLITGAVFILLVMMLIILMLKNRNKNTIIQLHEALHNIDKLERSLHVRNDTPADDEPATGENCSETIPVLRERLRNKLLSLHNNSQEQTSLSPRLLQSEAYHKLQEVIEKGVELKDNEELWKELEAAVLECSPNFRTNLQLLVGGKLTSYDMHTSILIKFGVSPTQMTVLLNRTKGTIVSRRESLSMRIFDRKLGVKVIDEIIRLL